MRAEMGIGTFFEKESDLVAAGQEVIVSNMFATFAG